MTASRLTKLGNYEILEVGRGGLGVIYKARDPALQREVAIKVVDPQLAADPDLVSRLYREARIAAMLRHPNIVVIHDIAEAGGRHFIVMEWLEGQSLDHLLAASTRLETDAALAILNQIGQALDYAHARGVMHRDVKPSNIIVRADGHATLTDFGLARVRTEGGLAGDSQQAATLAYKAPEQLDAGLGPIRPRADLYSLGVVAYQMLAGHPPFEGSGSQVREGQLLQEPPPLTGAPPQASDVLKRVLAKKPEDRYASCREFVTALREALGPADQEEPPLLTTTPAIKAQTPETGATAVEGMRRDVYLAPSSRRPEWLRAALAAAGAGLVLLIWLGVWGKTSGSGPLAPLFRASTPTPTITATCTATPTPTRTPTFTAAPTSTATLTSTATRTATPTWASTPQSTATGTLAPTLTATPSAPPPVPTNPPPPTSVPTDTVPPPQPTSLPPQPTSPPPPTQIPEPAPSWTPPV